jgi:hypothetical protein
MWTTSSAPVEPAIRRQVQVNHPVAMDLLPVKRPGS